jgi:hypothetical protein
MRNRKTRQLKKAILVLVDGESEKIYLNSFKSANIHIKPELPKNSIEELYSYFKKQKKEKKYDSYFWIIDLDVPIRENKIDLIKDYKNNYPNEIIINHPCLEFWFLLHYRLGNFGNDCNQIIRYLKNNFNEFKNYNKSEKEVKKITKILKEKLFTAINNAKRRNCDLDSLINCSEMFKFFEELEKLNN